jgi:hypothetical protein
MSAQLRLIRSRYKAMCASLGVRPRLQPAGAPPSTSPPGATVADGPGSTIEGVTSDTVEAGTEKRRQKTVWPLAGPPASASPQGLSF